MRAALCDNTCQPDERNVQQAPLCGDAIAKTVDDPHHGIPPPNRRGCGTCSAVRLTVTVDSGCG